MSNDVEENPEKYKIGNEDGGEHMDDRNQVEEKSLLDTGLENAVGVASSTGVNRILDFATDNIKDIFGKGQVRLGLGFKRYIDNAYKRYNQVKTLVTGTVPRKIVGKDNIYVEPLVEYREKDVSTSTVDDLIHISSNILIIGTGGAGKSMLMRYLFLNTVDRGATYIPVLLELRRISRQKSGKLSILELIRACMEEFNVELPEEQFEYSLSLGKYLFLMDGLDEVKESIMDEAVEEIQKFCSKYPKNICIVTSRPQNENIFTVLETFTQVKTKGLNVNQAVQLARKLGGEDEKVKEFCRQMEANLFERYHDFTENPLLLSMMYLVFMRNNSVPDHLTEFYEKAYQALYSAHDTCDKGVYHREFHCDKLDEKQFRAIFARFCFQTYFREKYEFSEDELIEYLEDSIQKLKISSTSSKDYLSDLKNIVCMLVQDGTIYRFSHRSFQTYFASSYIIKLSDNEQKRLFAKLVSEDQSLWGRYDLYAILYELEPDRFFENALEEPLRDLKRKAEDFSDSKEGWLRNQAGWLIRRGVTGSEIGFIWPEAVILFLSLYTKNLISNLRKLPRGVQKVLHQLYKENLIINPFGGSSLILKNEKIKMIFDTVRKINTIEEKDKNNFFEVLIEIAEIEKIQNAIAEKLSQVDAKRKLTEKNELTDLIDSL